MSMRTRAGTRADSTFLFVDIVGYTALTQRFGDEFAASLAHRLRRLTSPLLCRHGGEEVKALGDGLLLRTTSAEGGIALAQALSESLGRHGMPPVRIGIHSGPAVRRGSDWFGSTVNVAARVSREAGPGEILVTDATRRAARLRPSAMGSAGSRRLRSLVEPVDLWRAGPRTSLPTAP